MDAKLLDWACSVRRRGRGRVQGRAALPVLWLFADRRIADLERAVLALPCRPPFRALFGLVLRTPDPAERGPLAARLRPVCRRRGIALVVAGDARAARGTGAGLHLPSGAPARGRPVTAAAHGPRDLVAAARRGAALCFLSPVFATASHPGARPLGAVRTASLARHCRAAGMQAAALGGIDGASIRALRATGIRCAGAIGALTDAGG